MRAHHALFALALATGACGSSITVGQFSLDVASTQYLTSPGVAFCSGMHANQIEVDFADYSPVCKKDQKPGMDPCDPTIEHTALKFVLSPGGMPDFRLNGFPVNMNVTCLGGGGPAYVAFLHYPAGMGCTTPDKTIIATAGEIRVQQLDAMNINPFKATYDVTFGTQGHISGSFSVKNCD